MIFSMISTRDGVHHSSPYSSNFLVASNNFLQSDSSPQRRTLEIPQSVWHLKEKKCCMAFIRLNSWITWLRPVLVENLGIKFSWFSSPMFSLICFENWLKTYGHGFWAPLVKSFLVTVRSFLPSKSTNLLLSCSWFNSMCWQNPCMINVHKSSGDSYKG